MTNDPSEIRSAVPYGNFTGQAEGGGRIAAAVVQKLPPSPRLPAALRGISALLRMAGQDGGPGTTDDTGQMTLDR